MYITRLAPVVLGLICLYLVIPQNYSRATRSEYSNALAYYSSVNEEFIIWAQGPTGFNMLDEEGNTYQQNEGRRLLPFIFSHDMEKWNAFPLNIQGQKLELTDVRKNMVLRSSPRSALLPMPKIFFILESKPETSGYNLPLDVMLLEASKMRFINVDTGEEDTEKGALFTKAVLDAGAVFPFKSAVNNPDTKKSFDEGMLFIDANNRLFQMFMEYDKPIVLNKNIVFDEEVIAIGVSENTLKEYYGYVVTANSVYLLPYDKAPVQIIADYDPRKNTFEVHANSLDRTINIKEVGNLMPTGYTTIALDRDNAFIREYKGTIAEDTFAHAEFLQKGLSFLTPLCFYQFTAKSPHLIFAWRFSYAPLYTLFGALFGILIYGIWYRTKYPLNTNLFNNNKLEFTMILIFGLPASLLLMVFGTITKRYN